MFRRGRNRVLLVTAVVTLLFGTVLSPVYAGAETDAEAYADSDSDEPVMEAVWNDDDESVEVVEQGSDESLTKEAVVMLSRNSVGCGTSDRMEATAMWPRLNFIQNKGDIQ